MGPTPPPVPLNSQDLPLNSRDLAQLYCCCSHRGCCPVALTTPMYSLKSRALFGITALYTLVHSTTLVPTKTSCRVSPLTPSAPEFSGSLLEFSGSATVVFPPKAPAMLCNTRLQTHMYGIIFFRSELHASFLLSAGLPKVVSTSVDVGGPTDYNPQCGSVETYGQPFHCKV